MLFFFFISSGLLDISSTKISGYFNHSYLENVIEKKLPFSIVIKIINDLGLNLIKKWEDFMEKVKFLERYEEIQLLFFF